MAIGNKYDVRVKSSRFTYEFISEGPAGKILKRVQFQVYVEELKVYNLVLGDVDIDNEIHDDIRTNNSDTLRVLATVAFCVYDFLEYYPDCTVFVRGNTASRTRLYRMGISNNIELFPNNIHIFGYNNGNWHIFQEGVNYDAFIATKILNF